MKRTVVSLCAVVVVIGASLVASVLYNLSTYLQRDAAVVASRNELSAFREAVIAYLVAEVSQHDYLLSRLPADREILQRDLHAAHDAVSRFSDRQPAAPLDAPASALVDAANQGLELLEKSAKGVDEGDGGRALDMTRSQQETALDASIRSQARTLGASLDERLRMRIEACHASMTSMTQWVLVGMAGLALTTTALVWVLVHHKNRLRSLNVELTAARDRAQQATRDREQFLGMLSHELRTPLTPALITTEMLERSQPPESEERKDLTLVRQQLQIEARLIDDLLDVSRILRGQVSLQQEPLRLNDIVRTTAAQLAGEIEGRNQKLDIRLLAADDRVRGDSVKLQKAFWHLISNASKFAPDSGRVVVSSHNEDGRILVLVQDNGIGFTPEQREAIFQPFRQVDGSLKRHFGGLGLGLSLAKPIVELHGGVISAHSPGQNQGATFTVDLPVWPEMSPTSTAGQTCATQTSL